MAICYTASHAVALSRLPYISFPFHTADYAVAGEGELSYVNCCLAVSSTLAKSLTER